MHYEIKQCTILCWLEWTSGLLDIGESAPSQLQKPFVMSSGSGLSSTGFKVDTNQCYLVQLELMGAGTARGKPNSASRGFLSERITVTQMFVGVRVAKCILFHKNTTPVSGTFLNSVDACHSSFGGL